MINVFQPTLGAEELAAVQSVFASNWIGKGRLTDQFETSFAAHLGTDAALMRAISCATEGLFQAMALLDIGAGDEVILPTISFVGAGNAVAACGARPVFCDVDPRTLNPTAEMIAAQISPRTKAVIILQYGGVPGDMDALCDLTAAHNIALIEDCACGVASRWQEQACGTFGDIAIWSFDAMKILVTGDGGMLRCRLPQMAERAEKLLYLGLLTTSGYDSAAESRWWEFDVDSPSRRATMNDMMSAIGLEQLRKLPRFIARRQTVHQFYDEALAAESWLQRPPPIPQAADSSYYFYWVQTKAALRDKLATFLREKGIYTTFRYHPLHRVPFYGSEGALPNAEKAADCTLCLPQHQALSDADLETVVTAVKDFGRQHGA